MYFCIILLSSEKLPILVFPTKRKCDYPCITTYFSALPGISQIISIKDNPFSSTPWRFFKALQQEGNVVRNHILWIIS